MDMLRQIATRLEVVEMAKIRGVHLGDISDYEEVVCDPNPKLKV